MAGETVYVTKDAGASNLNDGSNATTEAWETAIYGFTNMGASNTLKFGTGTYDVARSSTYTPIPSGSSGSPTIITDNADGQVVFNHPGSGGAGIIFFGIPSGATRSPTPQYISFIGTSARNIKFDGEDQAACGAVIYLAWSLANNLYFENLEVANGEADGILSSALENLTFKNLYIYHNGSKETAGVPQQHGLYAAGDNLLVQGCTFDSNYGWGLHNFTTGSGPYTNVRILDNIAFNNGFGSGPAVGDGLFIEEGTAIIANNLSYKNAGSGIRLWRTNNTSLLHNTCHENGQYGINVGRATGTTSNTTIKNNICIDNGISPILIQASCTGTVATWNRLGSGESIDNSGDLLGSYSNNVADAVDTQAESGGYSGEFTDPNNSTLASRDYTLVAGAKSIGATTTNEVPTAGIAEDLAGTSRPQGSFVDQGAYEFGSDPPDAPAIGHDSPYITTAGTYVGTLITLADGDSNTLTVAMVSEYMRIRTTPTANVTVTSP